MKIRKILERVEKTDEKEFKLTSWFVENGYGQTSGGYMKNGGKRSNQSKHFINYYRELAEREPSFVSLWCPELMIFIAEVVGVKEKIIKEAIEVVTTYEDEHGLRETLKNATYLAKKNTDGEDVLHEFKSKLKIYEWNEILKDARDWSEVQRRIQDL